MANILCADKQSAALRLLVEGNSIRSTERITGIHRDTVMRLAVRFGNACRQFLDEEMRGLMLRHIQCDEIHTFVGKRQKHLTVDEKQTRHDVGEIYLWTALDTDSKLMPTFVLGKRSGDTARRLMMDLVSRLNMPRPQDWHSTTFDKVVQISTDAFVAYPEAVDMAFGPYVKYGTIDKDFRNANMKPGTYSPAELVRAKRKPRFGMSEDEMDKICTSHVERNNLTIRTFMKRFSRLSLGFSKKLENLAAATALHMAYYNFVWRPRYADDSGKRGRRRPTPAMAAGVTKRLWSFGDLFSEVSSRYL
jgi:IS1 family transposase